MRNPRVASPRGRRIGKVVASLFVVLAVATPASAQFGPAPVAVSPVVKRDDVAAGQTFVGTVMPVRTSTVGSAVSGRVEEFLVNESDRVKKGQPLARLRTQIIKAEVEAAEAELKTRQAELAELEAGSRPEEKAQAKAKLDEAEANRDFLRRKRQRAEAAGRGISILELEETLSLLNRAEATVRETQATWELVEKGPRKERKDQARARVELAQAEVNRLKEQLDRHTVVAPFDGYIAAERTEVGQWLMQGDPVAEVIELDQVDIEIPVLEDAVATLRKGATARVEISALPGEKFTGEVAIIVPRGNERARTFPVKVRVDNPRHGDEVLIKAGMFARVTLPVGRKEPALLVHKDALVLGGPSPVVYVVDPDGADPKKGKVRPVPVQLGVAHENHIVVKGDLKEGQQVVVQGNERLRPGQDVVLVQPRGK